MIITWVFLYLQFNFRGQNSMDELLDRNKRTLSNFITIILNSTSYFILSFFFMYLITQVAVAVAAMQFDFTSVLYYYKLVYTIDTYSWTPDAVKLLFSLAPVLSLLLGIIFFFVYFGMTENTMKFKVFFLWCFIHGVVWFFGAILAGTLLDKGFGYVVMYFYLLDTGKLIISLLSIAIMLFIAAYSTRGFLFSANSYFMELNEHNRTFFVFAQIVVPLVLGTAIIIISKIPKINFYELFVILTYVLIMIPVLLRFNAFPTLFFEEFPFKITLDKTGLVLAGITLVAVRVVLEIGIPFG